MSYNHKLQSAATPDRSGEFFFLFFFKKKRKEKEKRKKKKKNNPENFAPNLISPSAAFIGSGDSLLGLRLHQMIRLSNTPSAPFSSLPPKLKGPVAARALRAAALWNESDSPFSGRAVTVTLMMETEVEWLVTLMERRESLSILYPHSLDLVL